MGWLKTLVMTTVLVLLSQVATAATVKNVRIWLAPDHARLVFDLSSPANHKLFTLKNPDRLVLDIPSSRLTANLARVNLAKSPIKSLRSAMKGKTLRIVLDLKEKVRPRSFELKPNNKYGHRLVVDLYRNPKKVEKQAVKTSSVNQRRNIVISIDAGHGGDDPGAVGPGKTREKDVVLAIARELDRLLDREAGFRGELTRSGDYFISLRGRTKNARKRNADMFVSIHADGFTNPRARGASVWILSPKGASSEMGRWLARRENAADLIGGVGSVSLDDKDRTLKSVLLDMSMTASRSDSREVAKAVHRNMARFARMHKKHVEQAGFAVLKSPDIPSILVETGFITNPEEERKLKTRSYQRRMAKAIFDGIKAHFYNKPPANSWVAWKKRGGKDLPAVVLPASTAPVNNGSSDAYYKVVRGDSLSRIASRHGMSLAQLKKLNSLKSNTVRIGQLLRVSAPRTATAPVAQYRVVKGDSLSRIASRYGMTLAQLKSLNGLKSNTVRVGQLLKVRQGPVAAKVRNYKVVRGDSLSAIASRHGVSLASLKKANRLAGNTIRVGQVLRIPSS